MDNPPFASVYMGKKVAGEMGNLENVVMMMMMRRMSLVLSCPVLSCLALSLWLSLSVSLSLPSSVSCLVASCLFLVLLPCLTSRDEKNIAKCTKSKQKL